MSENLQRATACLPAVAGRDYAALAVLPFTLALREPTKSHGPINADFTITVDGKPRRISTTLIPGESGVLPVHADQMVHLALLQLAIQRHDVRDTLVFRRMEVFSLLRWPNRGWSYDRLEQSLRRLAGLTIEIKSSLVSRDGREYHKSTHLSHVIDSVYIGSGRDAECRVRWGDLVLEAFRLGDFKSLDWDLIIALGNPLTAQLYRVIDRATLSGQTQWEIDWQSLAIALGMSADGCARPARLRQRLEPHFETLKAHGVIEDVRYRRGGQFVFEVRNYLRARLRQVLEERFEVYGEAARQLLAGYDEVQIMLQCDCLYHGARPKPQSPGGYLVEAVRQGYELRYAADEPETFLAIWGLLSEGERQAYHRAGIKLLGVGEDLFETRGDPSAWSQAMRAVVRFLVCHNLDPEELLGPGSTSALVPIVEDALPGAER
jgi:hypothetical protein